MSSRLANFMPIVEWLPAMPPSGVRSDVIAGLTTAVMLVPQSMAYAMLAGLPPQYGLYASTVPLVAYALFGSSRQLAVGPVAIDSLLVASGVGAMAAAGSENFIALALVLAAMVGGLQLALGMLGAGSLFRFIPRAAVGGFTTGAALLILSTQAAPITANLTTVGLTLAAIIVLLLMKKAPAKVPGALLVVVATTLLAWLLASPELALVGVVPAGLPELRPPVAPLSSVAALLPTALAISTVGFLEATAVGEAMAQRHDRHIEPNRELLALGAANLCGSFFGSFPVTGGLSRTAVNDDAGATTPLASLVTAATVVVVLLTLTPLFHFVPTAALSAIIVVAVAGLVDVKAIQTLWRTDRRSLAVFLTSAAVTLVVLHR